MSSPPPKGASSPTPNSPQNSAPKPFPYWKSLLILSTIAFLLASIVPVPQGPSVSGPISFFGWDKYAHFLYFSCYTLLILQQFHRSPTPSHPPLPPNNHGSYPAQHYTLASLLISQLATLLLGGSGELVQYLSPYRLGLNLDDIVANQSGALAAWLCIPLLPRLILIATKLWNILTSPLAKHSS